MSLTEFATPAAAPLVALPTIAIIFDALAAKNGFVSRKSQTQLAEIVRSTLSGGIALIEAPTGTGKTLGYLAGALDYQAHSGDSLPVVIATATVGLQEQILRYDIPRLAAAGLIDPSRVELAKGRGRYFCPRTTAMLEDKKAQDPQSDMFQPEKPIAVAGTPIALDMLSAWRAKRWDGDQDSWEGELPACWQSKCAANGATCVGRVCEFYSSCPFVLSRAKLARARIVVANQDLVLADLARREDEQEVSALPFSRYALIVDEAHKLPDKAASTKRASAVLTAVEWLKDLAPYGEIMWANPILAHGLRRNGDVAETVFSVTPVRLSSTMLHWAEALAPSRNFRADGIRNWGVSRPAPRLLTGVGVMLGHTKALSIALKAAVKALGAYAEDLDGSAKGYAIRMLAQTHEFSARIKTLHEGLELFFMGEGLVRWAERGETGGMTLHTQPMEGSDVLTRLLWKSGFPTALVSATLQISGSFTRYKSKSGMPESSLCAALPPVFDYSRGFFHQPKMQVAPGESGYEAELADKIERLFAANLAPGTLIIFTAHETMRRVMQSCSRLVRDNVLQAGTAPMPELVARHKARIEAGRRSILVGLDSMAEGLDLPGMYCGHVILTRLPFGVPDDPVEEARHAHLGEDWFTDVYLADMLTTLIQATGRLIRRESDFGLITLLDKRLSTKRYAMQVFSALPQFSRGLTLTEYRAFVQKHGFDLLQGQDTLPIPPPARPAPALKVVSTGKAASTKTTKRAALTVVAAPKPVIDRGDPKWATAIPVMPARWANESALAWLSRSYTTKRPTDLVKLVSGQPCILPGAPAAAWAEYELPEAVALGMLFLNQPDFAAQNYERLLLLRPDALQFAGILRSHYENRRDARRELVTLESSRRELNKVFASLPRPPAVHEIFALLTRVDGALDVIVGGDYLYPSANLLGNLVGL